MFKNIYQNKKVLVTGHTGFKGAWLVTWLLKLDANVVGISKDVPTEPSMFEVLGLQDKISHYQEDIRGLERMTEIVAYEKPDFLFHLAAQAIVSTSYENPIETITSNVIGTTNILEALRKSNHKCTAVIITSDKAYENVEQIWGYKENDQMGGRDVYSGSKGAAELIIKSYYHSFFKSDKSNVRLAIARAGNVIGGGDWAKDRIVVDAVVAWHQGGKVEIRSPEATRPWQHVLEPLSGYLNLGQRLYSDKSFNGEGFNFGPRAEQNRTVKDLLQDLSKYWNFDNSTDAFTITDNIPFHEAGLLKLNCDKALARLKWQATLDYQSTIKFTSQWYYQFYNHDKDILAQTIQQISNYEELAKSQKLTWTV
jgi:CDP-glucose 4,6-dehydratase